MTYRTSRSLLLAHRDLASRIHVRNAPKADKPEPTRMTVRPKGREQVTAMLVQLLSLRLAEQGIP
jgi:hypothetical protein